MTYMYHGGRTDSKGGHRDKKNGGYHYHHGEPAHEHPNGVCEYDPYDYEEFYETDLSGYDYNFLFWLLVLIIIAWRYKLERWISGDESDNTVAGIFMASLYILVFPGAFIYIPTYVLFFEYLPDFFSYEKEYSFLLLIPMIIYLEMREKRKYSITIEATKKDEKVRVNNFKIHPSENSSFSEWVSYTPSSHISSIGRRQKISNKRPKHISYELINKFEKNGWGKISFDEFLENHKK